MSRLAWIGVAAMVLAVLLFIFGRWIWIPAATGALAPLTGAGRGAWRKLRASYNRAARQDTAHALERATSRAHLASEAATRVGASQRAARLTLELQRIDDRIADLERSSRWAR